MTYEFVSSYSYFKFYILKSLGLPQIDFFFSPSSKKSHTGWNQDFVKACCGFWKPKIRPSLKIARTVFKIFPWFVVKGLPHLFLSLALPVTKIVLFFRQSKRFSNLVNSTNSELEHQTATHFITHLDTTFTLYSTLKAPNTLTSNPSNDYCVNNVNKQVLTSWHFIYLKTG